MRSDPWHTLVRAGLAACALLASIPQAEAKDPTAGAFDHFQQQQQMQMQQQMMMRNYGPDFPASLEPLPAFVRIYASAGGTAGMGALHAISGKSGEKPGLSWIELAGKRYFPEDTDSIRVWDLTGIPLEDNWVFPIARGTITALTFHPMLEPEYVTLKGTDSVLRAGESAWNTLDTLWFRLPQTAQLERANGDPVMAFRLANTGRHRQGRIEYQALLDQADYACKVKRYGEADSLLALAAKWDPGYPRLHFHIGLCEERRADIPAALEAFRYALRYSGTDAGFRKETERKIRDLESQALAKRP